MRNSRRKFLQQAALIAGAGMTTSLTSSKNIFNEATEMQDSTGGFTLPPLPYAYDALEPFIDKQTMEIHYTKHHQAYINNLNKAMADAGETGKYSSIEELLKKVSGYNEIVRNNAGGHYNHSLFWKLLKPAGSNLPGGVLLDAINNNFHSFENFKTIFTERAMSVFGSGWVWLIVDENKKLSGIVTTQNQQNLLMDNARMKGDAVLALDVWEHAYYLKYQNRRAEYVAAWWNVINWEEASRLFTEAMK